MCLVQVLAGAGGKVHMAAACVMQAGKSAISRNVGTSAINDGLSHSSSAVGRRSVNNGIGKWVWADCLGVNRRDSALELTAGQGMEDAREEGGKKSDYMMRWY